MRKKLTSILILFSLAINLVLNSCSTEKDAALNVGYHNMTARYNGYVNARILMDETLEGCRESTSEDYTKILPLDLYPSKEEVPVIQEKYETAFEKCEKVIFRHSMPNAQNSKKKAVEHCRWIDDNWFVIGQIHYTRHEFNKAEEIFKFIQESPLYVDQERIHEARIWLAKTHIAKGNFPEAKRILKAVEISMKSADAPKQKLTDNQKKQLKKDKKNNVKTPAPFPKDLKDDYELTMAEFYIAQKSYKKAIEHLENGIELTKKRKTKARYQFVLAQLYQETGDGQKAADNFDEVVHSPAPYVMRFQAQINKAISATTGGAEIRKELAKMLKDPKNEEYKDQIYYALAQMDMNDNNIAGAKLNFSSSAFYSIKNNRQKGQSYLALGDITFNERDYLSAQKYYDSCVQVLPEDYEGYEKIKAKAEGLAGLVEHYEIYTYEDSVQRIALMPEDQLEKYLQKQLKQMEEDEERRKKEEAARLIESQNRVKSSGTTTGSGSKWYFYNQKVSSSGFNDFRALWGQRLLEDNWRRTNKTSFSVDDPELDPDADTLTDLVEENTMTVDILRAGLPLSPEALDSSNNRLMNSLYMLGLIYKEQLKEQNEAISYFSKIINRNIEHPKVLPALYQLYLLYSKNGSSEAEAYKQQILRDYAESEIAKIIEDPEYLPKKREREAEKLNEYSATLDNYRFRKYGEVISKCNQVIAYDSANIYINKYYLLKAYAIGKTDAGNSEAILSPLQALYKLDPTSEEGIQAKIYIDKLAQGSSIVAPDTNTVVKAESPYKFDADAKHYYAVIFPNSAGKVEQTKNSISNFNKEFFKSKRLQLTPAQLGTENQILAVSSFASLEEAKQYQLAFNSNQAKTSLGKTATDFEHFMISAANFTLLIQTLDLKGYTDFYNTAYPK